MSLKVNQWAHKFPCMKRSQIIMVSDYHLSSWLQAFTYCPSENYLRCFQGPTDPPTYITVHTFSVKKLSQFNLSFLKNNFDKVNVYKFLTYFIRMKDPAKKAELHLQYKNHRKLLSTFLKKIKKIIIRNTLSQIGIIPKSSGKVLNPS